VRIATWNVNSAKQRMPGCCRGWTSGGPTSSACRRPSSPTTAFAALLGEELASRGYEVAAHGEPQWNGVAILSRVGLDDVVAGSTAAGLPASGGARGGRDLWRDPGRLGVRAERAGAGLRALPLQARVAGRAAGRRRRRPGGDRSSAAT
jgi:hypothetical protein